MAAMNMVSVTSPTTGRELGRITEHDAAHAAQAFDRARQAQRLWARTPAAHRRAIMLRYHDLVLDRQDELLNLIQDESGKNRLSAFDEIMDVAVTARHYAYAAERLLRTRRAKGALPVLTVTHVQRDPKGVVGIISPWNYPLTLAVSDAIPALLAGNSVVLKPDSHTPLTALRAVELLVEAGLPQDVFQVVTGAGSVVGQQIVSHCDFLMFTGSTPTGRSLAAQAGERLIGFSAELGGKNPMIVAHDADPQYAARSVQTGCFANAGQLCISLERIYVHRAVAEEFITGVVAAVHAMRVGGGYDWNIDMGSLISADHVEKVAKMVDDAVAQGARVLAGGHRLPQLGPTFYAPTVLTDVPAGAQLYAQETFGPVIAIQVVDSEAEAISCANDSEFGLNASVFASPATGRRIAAQLQVGTVNINEGFAAAWGSVDAPMGGWKASGTGRRHGDAGLTKYTEERTVALQRLVPISGPPALRGDRWARVLSTALKAGKRLLR